METFVVAYSLVWLAVFFYVVRLDVRHRRISRKLEDLEARLEESRRALSEGALGNALRGVPEPAEKGRSKFPERHGGRSLQV